MWMQILISALLFVKKIAINIILIHLIYSVEPFICLNE